MEFFKKTNIDFIGVRKYAFVLSISLIIFSIGTMIVKRGLNFGIDFVGGTLLQIKMQPMPEINEVRKILIENELKTAQIQLFPRENEIIIRIKKGEISLVEEKFYQMFSKAFPQTKLEILRVEMVGPAVGKKLLRQAILALFWGMIGIMVYVGWRFEFKYSAPAVLAVVHDVLIITGMLTLLNKEITITIIAAILTLVGYSINDTIVIYDRIREKIRLFAKDELGKVMNIAINDTLSRTMITGLTLIIVLVVLFFVGGEVLHDFAFVLLFGVIIGTYSSIFVASPLVYEWEVRHQKGVRS